jgi:delta14-sterol reductase
MQKFACKVGGVGGAEAALPAVLAGWVSMETVPGSGGRLLCGGFWGLARHVNYAGEITQAVALALPAAAATSSPLPFLYPLYYVALFVPRQIDDDAVCAQKYGEKVWGDYVRRVPARIFPGIW